MHRSGFRRAAVVAGQGRSVAARRSAARGGEDLDEDQARYVRVVEYEVPDRDGDGKDEVIALVTRVTQMTAARAPLLAEAYHQRWEQRPGTPSSRRTCAAPAGCCGQRARTWSARRSTAIC